MRKATQTLRILLSLLLVSCVYEERPSDLRLERVYVKDMSVTSGYKTQVANGLHPAALRLAIEVSTSEPLPLGSLAWGFCGEKKSPEQLYRATDPNAEFDSGPSYVGGSDRRRYSAFLTIVFKLIPPLPALPNYDLRYDGHDLCLETGSGTYADVWISNEVRVPRSLIEKALHEPPHTHYPLTGP